MKRLKHASETLAKKHLKTIATHMQYPDKTLAIYV
jgi:hypothetical protein